MPTWDLSTNIRGPEGIQGPQGEIGPVGPTGSTGAQGPQGPPGTIQAFTSPVIINDPVGNSYPQVQFAAGDGTQGVPSSEAFSLDLYDNALRVVNAGRGEMVAQFWSNANGKVVDIGGWSIRAEPSALRILGSNTYFDTAGNIVGTAGVYGAAVYANSLVQTPVVQSTGNIIVRSTGQSYMQAFGAIGSPQAQLLMGAQWGTAGQGVSNIVGMPVGNRYNERPLTIGRVGGGGQCALGFADHITGWTASLQLFSDGNIYLGALNGDNSGYVKLLASAFQVISAQQYKDEIAPLEAATAVDALDMIQPVEYHDLQPELAAAVEVTHIDIEDNPYIVRMDMPPPLYRYGFVAEDVQAAAPRLTLGEGSSLGLDLSGMVAVLWQAVKDMRAEIAELRAT